LTEIPVSAEPGDAELKVTLEQIVCLVPALPVPARPNKESASPGPVTGSPDVAGRIAFRISKPVDSHFVPRARGIEQRDFSHDIRAARTISAAPTQGSLGRSEDPLEIEMSPCAPPNAAPW